MSGTWLKIAIFAVLVVAVIIGISMLSSDEPKPEPQGPQTYAEQVREDREKFAIDYENQSLPQRQTAAPTPASAQPAEQPQAEPAPQAPAAPPRQFRELELDEQVGAEQLYSMALNERSMGRLPGVGKYRRMVEYCRQIITQYPGTVYAYQAKQLLADIPREYQEQYGITADELDLSK
jgi:type IV secretory pathway VirB10-like protein